MPPCFVVMRGIGAILISLAIATDMEPTRLLPIGFGAILFNLTRILFPIAATVIAGLIAPESAALIGFLMFGNLIRKCSVLY